MKKINKKMFLNILAVPLIPINEVNLTAQAFGVFMGWFYKFTLGTIAFLAVLMIVIGGVQIAVSGGSVQKREDAKRRITQALFGLLLAVGAYLILYTINPDLVTTGLNINPITVP